MEEHREGVVKDAIGILHRLPDINRKVCEYMIKFLRVFADPVHHSVTKMNVHNLAMVFAPNFLRCPSDNPTTIFENTKYEQAFLRMLITAKGDI
ncbi:Rho GTPase activation protein [Polychytrium aggregatum]|uniref:Rho GTPase activation protein n=1 Tax=Polychytrium aggregatum TaxID=110093 RepID=UPI0022FECD19|nr:Rho GTPase activation protein [Polychytrium aggregatum]KAI9205890.1 Rho GTPase activation protein [Polychytrium aggregatum]